MDKGITQTQFDGFTVYELMNANSFVYADFNDEDKLIEGLANYIFEEINLLNYANTLTPIEFVPSAKIYKKLYDTIGLFLNSKLELLRFDKVTDEVKDILGQEYSFVNKNGETLVQKDKIGKIGEYIFHLLLTKYFKVKCIIPKFKCITDRNMSVFGIDALFFDPEEKMILFGESKVCKNIENAIALVNRSLEDYESQISEEYRFVLCNDDVFNLSREFSDIFKSQMEICISFEEFITMAHINKICVPVFLAHGKKMDSETVSNYLFAMRDKIDARDYFGMKTKYVFISLPILDKDKMFSAIMGEAVKKSNEYKGKHQAL